MMEEEENWGKSKVRGREEFNDKEKRQLGVEDERD